MSTVIECCESQLHHSPENNVGGTSEEVNYQMGRLHDDWKGDYEFIASQCGSDISALESKLGALRFYIVETIELGDDNISRNIVSIIPTSWMSRDFKFLLYPPPSDNLTAKSPVSWGERMFLRRRIPLHSWMEFNSSRVLNQDKPVNYHKAFQAAKAARANLSLSDILLSDREKQLGRGRRTIKKRLHEDVIILQSKKDKILAVETHPQTSNSSIESLANCMITTEPGNSSTVNATSEIFCAISTASASTSFSLPIDQVNTQILQMDPKTISNQITLTSYPDTQTFKERCNTSFNIFRPFCINDNENTSQERQQVPIITNFEMHTVPVSNVLENEFPYPHEIAPYQNMLSTYRQNKSSHWEVVPETENTQGSHQLVPGVWEAPLSLNKDVLAADSSLFHDDSEQQPRLSFQANSDNSSVLTDKTRRRLKLVDESVEKQDIRPLARNTIDYSAQLSNVILPQSDIDGSREQIELQSIKDLVSSIVLLLQGLDNKIDRIEHDIADKLSLLTKNLDELKTGDLSIQTQQHVGHHKHLVESTFKELPCNSVENLIAADVSLNDQQLAISLVCYLVNNFKAASTVNSFVNQVYSAIVSDETSQKIQWKPSPRQNDKRPGLGGCLNILAVIGVCLNTYSTSRNLESVAVTKLVELIKNSRKSCANAYRKRVKKSPEEAALALNDNSVVVTKTTQENDLITVLDRCIIDLQKAVILFRAPN